MKEQDKQELLARNKNIARLASQIRQEIDYISDITGDKDYNNVYSVVHALSDRIDSLCEYVDKGYLKGDNSKKEVDKICSILNCIYIGMSNVKIFLTVKIKTGEQT